MTEFDSADHLEKGMKDRLKRIKGLDNKVKALGWLKDMQRIKEAKKGFARRLYERFLSN